MVRLLGFRLQVFAMDLLAVLGGGKASDRLHCGQKRLMKNFPPPQQREVSSRTTRIVSHVVAKELPCFSDEMVPSVQEPSFSLATARVNDSPCCSLRATVGFVLNFTLLRLLASNRYCF